VFPPPITPDEQDRVFLLYTSLPMLPPAPPFPGKFSSRDNSALLTLLTPHSSTTHDSLPPPKCEAPALCSSAHTPYTVFPCRPPSPLWSSSPKTGLIWRWVIHLPLKQRGGRLRSRPVFFCASPTFNHPFFFRLPFYSNSVPPLPAPRGFSRRDASSLIPPLCSISDGAGHQLCEGKCDHLP